MITLIVSLVIIALLIADIFFVEYESYGWTTLSIIVTGGLLYFTKAWGVADWVLANAKMSVVFVAAYMAVGVVWSFVKWFSYLISYRDKFIDIKNNLLSGRDKLVESQYNWGSEKLITVGGLPLSKNILPLDRYTHDNLLDSYCGAVSDGRKLHNAYTKNAEEYSRFHKPIATENKSKIVAWICYWPWSLVGTIINDPLRRLVEFMFRSLKAMYQKMSDRIFAGFPDKNDV